MADPAALLASSTELNLQPTHCSRKRAAADRSASGRAAASEVTAAASATDAAGAGRACGGGDGSQPKRKGTRTPNLLAQSVPTSHLFDFKIPFYVRRRREEQRARQLQAAKRALAVQRSQQRNALSQQDQTTGASGGAGLLGNGVDALPAAADADGRLSLSDLLRRHPNVNAGLLHHDDHGDFVSACADSITSRMNGDTWDNPRDPTKCDTYQNNGEEDTRMELRRRLQQQAVRTAVVVSSESPTVSTTASTYSSAQTTSLVAATDQQRKRRRNGEMYEMDHIRRLLQRAEQYNEKETNDETEITPCRVSTVQAISISERGRQTSEPSYDPRICPSVAALENVANTAKKIFRAYAVQSLCNQRSERRLWYAHMCARFAQIFSLHIWPFKPLHPASWDDTTVQTVLEKGTIVAGEDGWDHDDSSDAMDDNRVLAFSVFTALSLGAHACGAVEAADGLYEQARAYLSQVFDVCDVRIAEILIALQYLAISAGDMERVEYFNTTALCIFNRLKAFDSDMYRRCMWTAQTLPNSSFIERKRLFQEYRNNTWDHPCWNEDSEDSLPMSATVNLLRDASAGTEYHPAHLQSLQHSENTEIHRFGWESRILNTDFHEGFRLSPSTNDFSSPPATTSFTSPDAIDCNFSPGHSSFSSGASPYRQHSQQNLIHSSPRPTQIVSSPLVTANYDSLIPTTQTSSIAHFTAPDRTIFHERYTNYQVTEENARDFLHTMIVLSFLKAKVKRKSEKDPKKIKILKLMIKKAAGFERRLKALGTGVLPESYRQTVHLTMISIRADCYWDMGDEVFALIALQDFVSVCRSIDMRLCAATLLPRVIDVIHNMQRLDQIMMLDELFHLLEGPLSLFPEWQKLRNIRTQPCLS